MDFHGRFWAKNRKFLGICPEWTFLCAHQKKVDFPHKKNVHPDFEKKVNSKKLNQWKWFNFSKKLNQIENSRKVKCIFSKNINASGNVTLNFGKMTFNFGIPKFWPNFEVSKISKFGHQKELELTFVNMGLTFFLV